MKRRTIYIGLFLIFIIGLISLIGTFAIDTTITEGNSSNADYLFNIILGDRTNREVVIPSYDSKIVDIKISNPNEFNMSYLLYLEGTNSNISMINISDTEASGILNSNNTNLIKVFIQNNSSTDIVVSIKDLVGFENEIISLPSNATAIHKGAYYKAIVKSNNNAYGKVKPNIKLSANAGTVKYNLASNTGYQYKSTTCNGTVVDNILTISNITSNISCEVVFEAIKVQVNLNLAGGVVETTYTEPKEHTYTVPYTGIYKLETWGAQGGVKIAGGTSTIGYGGYSVGNISLVKGTSLYVNVGGAGLTTSSASTILVGGYNGGGKGYSYSDNRGGASGGGATHIATVSGILSTLSSLREKILIVAGGGGGSDQCCNGYSKAPGSGGGYQGVDGIYNSESVSGATQTGGGVGSYDGSFGQGGNCESNDCAGGGGGYFGGGAKIGGGGYGSGGSGYIGNSLLTNKYMYCYNCTTSDATDTKTYTTTNTSSAAIANYAKSGNGAAKITIMDDFTLNIAYNDKYGDLPTPTRTGYTFGGWYTGENGTGTKVDENTVLTIANNHTLYAKWNKTVNVTFDVAGGVVETTYTEPKEHTYTVPSTGNYKLETWGAQGGSANSTYIGGYGGYSVGNVNLSKDDIIYINVGGKGEVTNGGYNGGGVSGSTTYSGGGGGGATHIATVSGLLSTLSSKTSNILIAAGGGGGGVVGDNNSSSGGSGGGYIGNNAISSTSNYKNPTGGTQTAGGSKGNYGDNGSFGQGGKGNSWSGGGGAGYYGGGGGHGAGGGGGSGYIGNSLLTDKYMYCYNCTTSDATDTKTYTTTNTSSAAIANYAKSGDGAAKITIMDDFTLDMSYNDKYGDLPTPTRTDYMFDGWYTGENGTGTKVDENTALYSADDHTLYAKWTPLYRLDLNGYLDGVIDGGLGEYGTADVYINGVLVCDDCTDYCTQHPTGTTYLITDIKTTAGHTYNGVYMGQLSGTITDGEVKVFLNFSKNRSIPAFTYTGSSQIVDDSNNVISSPSTYVGNWKIRFLSSGTLTFSDNMGISSGIDIFVVGGGGSGATGSAYIGNNSFGGGGGGGGAAITVKKFLASSGNSYSIVVGGSKANSSFGLNGTAYFTALAGGSASAPYFTDGFVIPIPYGAGGAGRLSGQTSYYGASSVIVKAGGAGDSYGSKDSTDGNYEFNETGNKRYGAGGGSGGHGVSVNIGGFAPAPGSGGADGGGTGGKGCSYTWSTSSNSYVTSGAYGGSAGTANTGSGGGGGGSACGSSSTSYGNRGSGASGGSGIVIIRNTR